MILNLGSYGSFEQLKPNHSNIQETLSLENIKGIYILTGI